MALRPGDLNHQVEIRQKVSAPKSDGGPGMVTSWQTIGTPWCKVEGLAGRESVIGEALQGIAVYRVTMRYREDFGPADQLRYRSLDLNVRSVTDPDGRREQIVVIADTGSAQATA